MSEGLERNQMRKGDDFVTRWQGARFTWNGRTRDEGTDCWGLAIAFAREVLGRELTDWRRADHSRRWVRELMTAKRPALSRFDAPREGCLVLVTLRGDPHHVGIFWRGGILHAAEGRGVLWERLAEFAAVHPALEFAELTA